LVDLRFWVPNVQAEEEAVEEGQKTQAEVSLFKVGWDLFFISG